MTIAMPPLVMKIFWPLRAARPEAPATRMATLRAVPELASNSDSQLWRLLPFFDEVSLPAGAQIAREGERCSEFVVVMHGRLQATASRGPSRSLRAGDSVGWNAMWERAANDSTVVVEADSRLLVMGHAQFRAAKAATLARQPVRAWGA